jgi:hypothetical protein
VICLAATKLCGDPRGWSGDVKKLALAATLGLLVNLPGALVAYPWLHVAATESSRNTLTAFQYDPAFNHVRFNYRLLGLWMAGKFGGANQPAPWPPPTAWWFSEPTDATPEKTVDLRKWATPQSAMLRDWTPAMSISQRQHYFLRLMLFGSLVMSIALFFRLTMLLRRKHPPAI